MPDAVQVQTLLMARPVVSGSFDYADLLRVTLAVIDLDVLDPEIYETLIKSYFNSREIGRLNQFKHARRKSSYTIGRLAAKFAIKQHCPSVEIQKISVESGVFDQPLLIGDTPQSDVSQLGVSISHSNSYAVALVFHRAHPMGVDIDLPTNDDVGPVLSELDDLTQRKLIEFGLSDVECASLIWTARESLAKALTTGMMTPLSLYCSSEIKRQGNCFVLRYKNFAQYQTCVWPGKKGWLAVTMPARTEFQNPGPDWK